MSFILSTQSELLKTKRTASVWLSIIGAAFIPTIFFLVYTFNSDKVVPQLKMMPWEQHFGNGWSALNSFLLPMYIILICAMIPQIEFKNNTWKQVFSSPQSTANIYFSKLLTVHLMILLALVLFNVFMISVALISSMINSGYPFLKKTIDWNSLLKLNLKTYISVLGISAIQYWLSLRFKSFIGPVGIGLAFLVGSLIATGFNWEHVSKIPYAHPVLTLKSMMGKGRPFLENHELN
ncbi:MAG TPA: ABC transporter permease, partial [Chitinophagaceae bacterium]|nr:ABC transporter permease [Chitinophagaceae bacterium]